MWLTVAKQARVLETKLRIARGDEDSDQDEGQEEDGREHLRWGANKRHYYDADIIDMEGSEDEEALKEEEEEARRMQRDATAALHSSDFGVDEEESDDDDSQVDGLAEQGGRAGGKIMSDLQTLVEEVPRDLDELDDEARAAAVRQDALELGGLVSELRGALGEIRGRLGPLLREIREGELATAEGISYLEAKHTLLIHYAAAIMFYVLLKSEGRSVRNHPVVTRLVEIRAYLEKIRPIDKRLQYQIDKLLTAAQRSKSMDLNGEITNQTSVREEADATKFGPRPEGLMVGAKESAHKADGIQENGGVYKAPRINPIAMDLEEAERKGKQERRRQQFSARRAAHSSFVQELAAEMEGAPEEVRGNTPLGMDTAAARQERRRLSAREAVEEELMIRVPLTKEERKRLKAQRRAGLSGKALLDDFGDDLADIVDSEKGVDKVFGGHRANQKFGADLSAFTAHNMPQSGDADIPERDSLSNRRARMDAIRARALANLEGMDVMNVNGVRGEEDEFYREAKAKAASKKRQRQGAHRPADLPPPLEDPKAPGARHISSAIEKNRGLTPHRRKDLKNPRKKHRIKYTEATVRRKGQVQDLQPHAGASYGGEATGIKSRISKSVKF